MSTNQHSKLGPAGRLARAFTDSPLTPLLIVATLLLGFLAVGITPREEEPQILVPMVDVMVPLPGATPEEVESRVTIPYEKQMWGLSGVEYVYSMSRPGMALLTLRFKVGTELEPAVVRVHHRLREYGAEIGIPDVPLVRSYTIDDVPFMALTFHGPNESGEELRKVAKHYSDAIASIADISRLDLIGGESRSVHVYPIPEKLKDMHTTVAELFAPLKSGNTQGLVGHTESIGDQREAVVEVNEFLRSAEEVSQIVVGIKGGRVVRIADVARVVDGPSEPVNRVVFVKKGTPAESAVTLSLAKRSGTNASELANRVEEMVGALAPNLGSGVTIDITRNYGDTAKEKSDELIKHLLIASVSVVVLIALALGIRFGLVVSIAVPVTLALTLLIYYLFGYTLNRVTLFALIFSIGILVDDAIVVIENVHRHLHEASNRGKSVKDIIILAVNEVGNPTILATFTVIAAILPMAFVRGLMGPYMRPIPVGASLAMLFSLIVAFTITPWGALKLHKKSTSHDASSVTKKQSALDRLYYAVMNGLLNGGWRRSAFFALVGVLFLSVGWLVYDKIVRVKMLPFDNKSEFQVVIDLDEGHSYDDTFRVASEMGRELEKIPELKNYQIYAGTASPINFNGLVRHYFMRQGANQGDIQVNLIDRHERSRQSHEIAKSVRADLVQIANVYGARVKVVEIPPGPPVLSTLVAEVYGPTQGRQLSLAKSVKDIFSSTSGVVDVDWMVDFPQEKKIIEIDRKAASIKRVPIDRIQQTIAAAMGGSTVGTLHVDDASERVPIMIRLPKEDRVDLETLMGLSVPADDYSFVPIREVARAVDGREARTIYRKNLQRVIYVIGDLAGSEESPIYALQAMNKKIDQLKAEDGGAIDVLSTAQPTLTTYDTIKWDGEWQISYEVFRDLGIAFAIVLVLIYILVVGWFKSYIVPIVIMIPIPLSLIGIIPGHWIFNAFFTATSMIGFIAGAGIIVRNSIILVDFIELRLREGMPLKEAVIDAGLVRFRPMLLTAGAVVVGSTVILFDPIFQGLAISLMMGEVAATLLSRFAVPLLYYMMVGKRRVNELTRSVL